VSAINVLEVRFRNDDDQPWSYEVPTITYDHAPHHDWRPVSRRHSAIRYWEERVVPYVRQERHAGTEVPDTMRAVLAYIDGAWTVATYEDGHWYTHNVNDGIFAEIHPTEWLELPSPTKGDDESLGAPTT
jgi:hypothetical protein